jgi:hypothetical protein
MRRFRKRLLIWQVSGEVVSEFLQGVDVSILEGEQGIQSLARIYVLYVEKQAIQQKDQTTSAADGR